MDGWMDGWIESKRANEQTSKSNARLLKDWIFRIVIKTNSKVTLAILLVQLSLHLLSLQFRKSYAIVSKVGFARCCFPVYSNYGIICSLDLNRPTVTAIIHIMFHRVQIPSVTSIQSVQTRAPLIN